MLGNRELIIEIIALEAEEAEREEEKKMGDESEGATRPTD